MPDWPPVDQVDAKRDYQAQFGIASHRTNEVMRVLTVMSVGRRLEAIVPCKLGATNT